MQLLMRAENKLGTIMLNAAVGKETPLKRTKNTLNLFTVPCPLPPGPPVLLPPPQETERQKATGAGAGGDGGGEGEAGEDAGGPAHPRQDGGGRPGAPQGHLRQIGIGRGMGDLLRVFASMSIWVL